MRHDAGEKHWKFIRKIKLEIKTNCLRTNETESIWKIFRGGQKSDGTFNEQEFVDSNDNWTKNRGEPAEKVD